MKDFEQMKKNSDYFIQQISKHKVEHDYLIGVVSCYIDKDITDKIIKQWLEWDDKH